MPGGEGVAGEEMEGEDTLDGEGGSGSSSVPPLGLAPFGFQAKTAHDANEALQQTRSRNYSAPPPVPDADIWKRPPPDFRYIEYDPKPPKRNTVDSQQPWLYGTLPGQTVKVTRERGSLMPLLFRDRPSSPPPLITRFRIARPFTAKKQFVAQGMYPAGTYDGPKPHDFRQYPPVKSLGLDEFVTSYERDPYNIRFQTDRLNTVHGLNLGPPDRDVAAGRQMAPPMSAKPKWDRNLILDKTKWPQRPEAFTRHRLRNRNQYSAFMERVERELTYRWSREKQEFESRLVQDTTAAPFLHRQQTSL